MSAADDPTLRALVGGVLWPGYLGHDVPDWLRREIGDGGLAGAVMFSQNLPAGGRGAPGEADASAGRGAPGEADASAGRGAPGEAGRVSRPAFRNLRDDVLVGIDEEGGNVTRLEASTGSTLPGAAQLGFVDDTDATTAVGRELARRSLAVGANVVLAPVADVNTDPRNPVIGVRAFGDTAELVSRHVVAAVRGIQSAGAAACVKHFPGHGDTHLDSHLALPTLPIDADEIERMHLPPFQAAIEAGVAAIMTGHLVVPEWGAAPATLNSAVLARLRGMGFEGVIVSDALDMAAIRETVGAGPGAVQALLAGADLLCVGNPLNLGDAAAPDQDERDFHEVQAAILAALDDGTLPVSVLEAAAARVRILGGSLAGGGLDGGAAWGDDEPGPFDAASVARAAISIDGDVAAAPGPRIVLDLRGRPSMAVEGDTDHVARALAAGGRTVRVDVGAMTEVERTRALEEALAFRARRPVVVLVDAVGVEGAQVDAVARIAGTRPDAVVVNVGMPSGPLALPAMHLRAGSRLAGEAADAQLAGSHADAAATAGSASA
ncbi:glycoside hydrolase family 3 protein [Agromyces sp. Marseille-P2726]|uniref:glycoside hydrolase family 3 protein n=1 Tax=Agromyces sp. Marseille-P2726 TaxID=2709132 RepID=UPI00156DDD98|nr:glycoside hydrolase family 3 protein [Agromyces sp. Marseille-P2726]